LVIFE
jgi:hypothetical protein